VFYFVFQYPALSFHPAEPTSITVKGLTLTYYRAPDRLHFREQSLDRYNSFLKDETGNLVIELSGLNRFSLTAHSNYQGYRLKTQKGNAIEIYQEIPSLRRQFQSNCHGYTFLDGEYWMLSSQVERLLDDNGWSVVTESLVERGDVAVYREASGRVCHTARVIGRDADGHVLVNSKNGFEELREGVRAVAVPFI
jgi:hypothetical protein